MSDPAHSPAPSRWAPVLVLSLVVLASSYLLGYEYARHTVEAQQAGCQRGVAKELRLLYALRPIQRADTEAAHNPRSNTAERRTRQVESDALSQTIREGTEQGLDPAHGGGLVCAKVYPQPALFPPRV